MRCGAAIRFPSRKTSATPPRGVRGIDNFESFMQFLAPVPRGAVTRPRRAGERVFARHRLRDLPRPVLTTGPSANPLFDRKPVPLFSDLLLHDVGTGDGIAQAAALPEEIRTPALWGLRLRRPLLHDGSAATIPDAIQRHGGEAALARRGDLALLGRGPRPAPRVPALALNRRRLDASRDAGHGLETAAASKLDLPRYSGALQGETHDASHTTRRAARHSARSPPCCQPPRTRKRSSMRDG